MNHKLRKAVTGMLAGASSMITVHGARTAASAAYENWYPHGLERSIPARFPDPVSTTAAAFFVVHHGGPLSVELCVLRPEPAQAPGGIRVIPAVFWQFYASDERSVRQEYHPFVDDTDREYRDTVALAETPAGIYQLRYAKSCAASVDLKITPEASFAIMPCRTRMRGISEAYLYVPPGNQEITIPVYAATVELTAEDGETIATFNAKRRDPVNVTGPTVLRVQIKYGWEQGAFNIVGIPPILCPDEHTARNIRGSVEVAPDGRVLPHKFQRRMWDWMHALKPEELAVEPQSLLELEPEWLKDPRNIGLLGHSGGFNHIARILRDQDLDPASPTYGLGINTTWLGPAYVIDQPINPYRRNRAVLNRLLLHEFAQFLKLNENGTFNPNHWSHYFGGDGLGYRQRSFQFGYVAPLIEADLRELWFEGVSKVLNRAGMTRVTCENQTAGWLLDLHMLGHGSNRPIYKTMAHDFAVGLESPDYNPFMRTGYQQEAYGPDATYQGLSTCQQAIYFKYSHDETVRAGLRRIYDLLNHTVAPEPDGTIRGASNFSHRTTGSWVQRQYNGGLRLMADELPEAGVWYADTPARTAEESRAEIAKRLRLSWDDAWYEKNMRWLSSYAYHPWLGFYHEYIFPRGELCRGSWPVLAENSFVKNANDEFLFVKRPAYYAAVYTGRTCHEWVRPRWKPVPFHRGWKLANGVLAPVSHGSAKAIWRPTQGLCMLWTPAFGSALLAKNWNAYTLQIVRADLPDGKVAWPDYWTLKHTFDAAAGRLDMGWSLWDIPVDVTRTIAFEDELIRQTVQCTFRAAVQVQAVVEQLPLLQKEGMQIRFRRGTNWHETPGDVCAGVRVTAPDGSGVELRFANPVPVSLGPTSRLHGQDITCLEASFGDAFSNGDVRRLSYTITPLEAVRNLE